MARTNTDEAIINAVHLDLKGVLFKSNYFEPLMRDLAAQKVNAVLVEYEDVFPFEGIDVAWDPKTAWNRRTLNRFLQAAAYESIEVIPLQQGLGHLEYVFRWQRYRNFAEDPAYPSTLCLANADGKELVLNMLQQVLDAHPDSRYIHLGMDEAHALATCKKCAAKGDVLATFLRWLKELIEVVEAAGKTPIIWSDMLEDNFSADRLLGELRERVVLAPWDYQISGDHTALARLEGWRVSKTWRKEPTNPDAPQIGPGQKYIEDMSKTSKTLLKPYRDGPYVRSLFQVDLWTHLGFRVLGAGGLRISGDGPVMPQFNERIANAQCWARAVERTHQLGLIGTSWARGTTFCPPNFSIDLCWPVIGAQSKALGFRPAAFWPGVPTAKVQALVETLGRCRDDWRLELEVVDEMEALMPQVRDHPFEWQSVILMARTWALLRRASFALEEVHYFQANKRLPAPEWDRRLAEQKEVLNEIRHLRHQVREHFGKRYHGEHFKEWIRDLFDGREQQLRQVRDECKAKRVEARQRYAATQQ